MSREDLVAERYARALFLVAERRGEIFECLDALVRLRREVAETPRVDAYFRSPLVPQGRKRAIMREAVTKGAPEPVRGFMDLLLRKERLPLFPAAVDSFERQVRAWQGLEEAEVVSAVPLTEDERARLHAGLQRRTGLTIELKTRVDPDLVGGLYVRIGDHVLDRSVQGLLRSLRERLAAVELPPQHS